MRRTVLLIPELLSQPGAESVLRQPLPTLALMAERGSMFRVAKLPEVATPEALYLGMSPQAAQMAQGPLTVAALGADPPERSTHFHLSLLSLVDGKVLIPKYGPKSEELDRIWESAKRLDTKSLTLLRGEGVDHGLVWEGLGDMETTGPAAASEKAIRDARPHGDADRILGRLIDDSVNLLDDLELNAIRRAEDLPALNLLWPWGQGRRVSVPNLFLRRGERAVVESGSMRLQGLTRLASYEHGDRSDFGAGVNTRLSALADRCLRRDLTIALIEAPQAMRSHDLMEELEWFAKQLDEKLLTPLANDVAQMESRLTLLALSAFGIGLGVELDSKPHQNRYQFDERAVEEPALPTIDLWQAVNRTLGQ